MPVTCSKLEPEVISLSDLSLDLVEAAHIAVCFAGGPDEGYGWPHSWRSRVCIIAVDWARR
jgi:hypothetical protein